MHELGIVFHMVDVLEDVAREMNLATIDKVVVEIGEVSGVVTDFFDDAWRWASNRSDVLRGAQLEVHQIQAITVCNDCGKTYGTVEYGITCPYCASRNTELLRGRELEIREIEASEQKEAENGAPSEYGAPGEHGEPGVLDEPGEPGELGRPDEPGKPDKPGESREPSYPA